MKRALACMTLAMACSHSPSAAPGQPAAPAAPAAAAPAAPSGVSKTLAAIDVFGSRRVSNEDIVAASGLVAGGTVVFPSPELFELLEAAKRRLTERYHFALVEVSPISYFGNNPDAGKVFITIDVVDADDTARLVFAPKPTKTTADPEGLVAAWLDYEAAVWPLHYSGAYKGPHTCKGGMHCALGFNHPDLEHREDLFIAKVPDHVAELTAVLRDDREDKRRAAAAFLLPYARDRQQVIDALVPSIDDASGLVRNNVMRVLALIQEKADGVVVPLPAVLRAMHYPTTTDRNKAAYMLAEIATRAPAEDRVRIEREVGDVLVAMAAMKQPNNRDPAVKILQAISGEDHGNDAAAWRRWLEARRRK
ncbi:MAG TPA: hypothetical protein VGD80_13415 [Kofleriaceae bacterium]